MYKNTLYIIVALLFGIACGKYIAIYKPLELNIEVESGPTISDSVVNMEGAPSAINAEFSTDQGR